MVFSSAVFLYAFLPAVLLLYFIIPQKLKNGLLLLASLFFYFFGEPIYTVLLLFSSVSDWLHSLFIESHRGTRAAKAALVSSVIINLGMLFFFKYIDFFIRTINSLFGTSIPETGIPLPIGISFFTFQTMSYTIDVYRNRARAQKNLVTFATFVCLFPQLIAGPIVRYTDISEELVNRKINADGVSLGMRRFTVGLGKKVLIANVLGELCSAFRASDGKSTLFYWVYALAFTLQIYFDFSGYSDMAIGLGKILGFTFPENFNYPFISRSITEFWRRWHMTLGSFFRDYVYIPLGGNRVSRPKWLLNIAIVWMLTGLWHGAEWNFVLWGLLFAVLLVIEKLWIRNVPSAAGHIYTAVCIVISFVIFNADGLSGVKSDLSGLFGLAGLPFITFETLYYLKSYAVVLIIALVGSTPAPKRIMERVPERTRTVLEPVAVGVLLVVSTAFIVDGSFNPFLYFRF